MTEGQRSEDSYGVALAEQPEVYLKLTRLRLERIFWEVEENLSEIMIKIKSCYLGGSMRVILSGDRVQQNMVKLESDSRNVS
uniref:Uncharacterized protein n=1 Tax=Vespula pensylvanica TaxID=30213 RepID=A0A834JGP3_VESPE|nr:hypothetical protein H0235_018452 [Vespula pensylvanica]